MEVLDWDYSALAAHYDRRAPYAECAIDALLGALAISAPARVADIGAGTGRLSLPLQARGLQVVSVEPNGAMRAAGQATSVALQYVNATGEVTGLPGDAFDLVGYGSSFNVLQAEQALIEAARLLRGDGAIVLLWNHRDLDDPLQRTIEHAIRRHVPDYGYGSRREDPTPLIDHSGLFGPVTHRAHRFLHTTSSAHFLDGFRAHATLARQAGARLPAVLADIAAVLGSSERIAVPFHTRVWYARRRR